MSKSKTEESHDETRGHKVPLLESIPSQRSAQPAQPRFEHDPLDLIEDSIRLLQILPGNDEDLVRLEMWNTAVTESSYVCLSYTWQPSHPEHEIRINGYSFTVGERPIPLLHRSRPFWIDALCTDQSNTKEKNHQVRRMENIYRTLKNTVVWLRVLPFDLLRFFQTTVDIVAENPSLAFNQSIKPLSIPEQEQLRQQILQLYSLSYWSRAWIAQELLLPQIVMVNSGEWVLNLDTLSRIVLRISSEFGIEEEPSGLCYNDMFERPISSFRVSHNEQGNESPHRRERRIQAHSLPYFVGPFAKSGCSDKRDRIYALLALATDASGVGVDYDIDHIALFR
ncbi:hypothetical protein K458DRAFT_356249, partial [Lentithecium fluviatile CBS 122367]